jgi:hypothetical protein
MPNSSAGPISLRSAANSPGSNVPTPRQPASSLRRMAEVSEPEDLVMELGGGQGGGVGDEDVEPMDLGPPAHGEEEEEEADVDIEAEFMQGLLGDESEESEAE